MGGINTASDRGSAMSYGFQGWSWLWPGLPQMWVAGQWRGLGMAVGFGLAIECLLLSAYVWDEMLTPGWMRGLEVAVAAWWIVGVVVNRRWISQRRRAAADDAAGDLFPSALAEYLQGNWFVAEQRCRELIAKRRDDVDARLLLATLLRHIGRCGEARAELDLLEKFDGAAKWALEIAHERLRLEEVEEAEEETAAESENPESGAIRHAA